MLTRRVGGSGRADPRALDVPRRRVAHRVAAAAHAELAADGRQRQHGHRRVAAVAVALEAPAAAHERRRAASRRDPRTARAPPRSMPARSAARSNVHGSARSRSWSAPMVCSRRNASSAAPLVKRCRCMASATATSVPGRTARCRSAGRASGVDRGSITTSVRAALLRLAHVRDEVDARRRRVHAPEHDQLRVRVVLVDDRRHLAVERRVRRAGRRRADRPREPRRAEATPQRARRGCPASAGRSSRRRSTAGSTRRRTPPIARLEPFGDERRALRPT